MHEPCLLYIYFIPWPNGNVADRRFLIRSHASLSYEVVVCYLQTMLNNSIFSTFGLKIASSALF